MPVRPVALTVGIEALAISGCGLIEPVPIRIRIRVRVSVYVRFRVKSRIKAKSRVRDVVLGCALSLVLYQP